MISLPNGCYCSDIKVSPANWNRTGATTKKTWRVYYRFFDPLVDKPLFIEIKAGINRIKDLQERRNVVKDVIQEERFKLEKQGYNPITGSFTTPIELQYEIEPTTPFILALKKAKDYLGAGHETLVDMKAALKVMEKAATQLRLNQLPINKVSIRFLTLLLIQCGKINPRWSARRHNMYRSYLIMLYKKLVKLEAVVGNPALDLERQKEFKKLKVVLTSKQRQQISEHLKDNHNRFWHFVNLFFHSGGRKTELMQLKPTMVDLKAQKYRCIVKKGKVFKEVERTIKDVALDHWKVFLEGCRDSEYLFGVDFLPSKKAMSPDTISRWWQRIVKDKKTGLGINVDFYSLKHLHTDELTANLGIEDAAKHNEHTQAIAESVYAVGEAQRRHERIKKVGNKFA
jgi:integrase